MKSILLLVLLFLGFSAFARDTQTIRAGQYVLEDGKLIMLTSTMQRYDHPLASRVQPLANLGTVNSFITAICQNAAGKWQVTYRVEAEKGAFDVLFQLSAGDEWILYAVNPQFSVQPSLPLTLRVVSISANAVEVEIKK